MTASEFVNDWEVFHLYEGDTHCGTNERRRPIGDEARWWKEIPIGFDVGTGSLHRPCVVRPG